MSPIGVFEIFYGLPWSKESRFAYADFMKNHGFDFYIYGPKADAQLRKHWFERIPETDRKYYVELCKHFKSRGLQFGMALGPQGLQEGMNLVKRNQLIDKIKSLSDLGIDILGLFFDDMKSAEGLAEHQLEIMQLVQQSTDAKIVFCPSFYSEDPLLDMLFGDRPENYLETIGKNLDSKIEILWTGESVISKEISATHLEKVSQVLKRKPFICDNFYANDGPANCQFLKLVPPDGRSVAALSESCAWGMNPMNQAALSQVVLAAYSHVIRKKMNPNEAYQQALKEFCSADSRHYFLLNSIRFAEDGIDSVSPDEKLKYRQSVGPNPTEIEREVIQWMDGNYTVDFSVVIDQSGYSE